MLILAYKIYIKILEIKAFAKCHTFESSILKKNLINLRKKATKNSEYNNDGVNDTIFHSHYNYLHFILGNHSPLKKYVVPFTFL